MKKSTAVGIIIGIGVLILLKIFQDSIRRINDPLTNIIVFASFVLLLIIYGVSRLRKK